MNDIERIRHLLSKYYDGMTTRGEELELTALLTGTPDLPSELLAEREIFLAMYAPDDTAIEIPDNLTTRVDEAMASNRKRKLHRIIIQTISSAAAVLLLFSAGLWVTQSTPSIPEITPMPDFAAIQPAEQVLTKQTDTTPAAEVTSDKIPTKKQKSAKRRKSPATPRESNVIIVTDPEAAELYAECTLNILAANFDHADMACANADEAIYELNNTLTDILK